MIAQKIKRIEQIEQALKTLQEEKSQLENDCICRQCNENFADEESKNEYLEYIVFILDGQNLIFCDKDCLISYFIGTGKLIYKNNE